MINNYTEDINVGNIRLNVAMDAMEELKRRGLFQQQRDYSDRPQLPPNITHLDDNSLGDFLNQISIYAAFVEEGVARAKGELDTAKNQEDFARARVRIEIRDSNSKMKPDELRDLLETDKRIVEVVARTDYYLKIYEYAKGVVQKSVQQDWDTVSRRITQRGQDVERMRRGENVGNQQRDSNPSYSSPFAQVPLRIGH